MEQRSVVQWKLSSRKGLRWLFLKPHVIIEVYHVWSNHKTQPYELAPWARRGAGGEKKKKHKQIKKRSQLTGS